MKKREIHYFGGPGDSYDNAFIIEAPNFILGTTAQFQIISKELGQENQDWFLESQIVVERHGISYDIVNVRLKDNQSRRFHFQIQRTLQPLPQTVQELTWVYEA